MQIAEKLISWKGFIYLLTSMSKKIRDFFLNTFYMFENNCWKHENTVYVQMNCGVRALNCFSSFLCSGFFNWAWSGSLRSSDDNRIYIHIVAIFTLGTFTGDHWDSLCIIRCSWWMLPFLVIVFKALNPAEVSVDWWSCLWRRLQHLGGPQPVREHLPGSTSPKSKAWEVIAPRATTTMKPRTLQQFTWTFLYTIHLSYIFTERSQQNMCQIIQRLLTLHYIAEI